MADVILFGDINADVLMSIPEFPAAGDDAMASRLSLSQGGSAANSAVVLAKLGLRTGMIGCTGDDHWGELARAALEEFGVNLEGVSYDPHDSTGLIFIPITDSGERTLFSYRGANTRIHPQDIDPRQISSASILHLSGYIFLHTPQKDAAWRAVETAREQATHLSLDTGLAPVYQAKNDLLRLLPLLDLLILGEEEARTLTGRHSSTDAVASLIDQGIRVIGLKLGRAGCIVVDQRQAITIPPFDVTPIDATGAGDAFSAGLIFSWMNKFNLPAAGIFANAMGALAVTVRGGGSAFPPRRQVLRFLKEQSVSFPHPTATAAFEDILAAIDKGG